MRKYDKGMKVREIEGERQIKRVRGRERVLCVRVCSSGTHGRVRRWVDLSQDYFPDGPSAPEEQA